MLRNALFALSFFLTACGIEAVVPAVAEDPQPLTTEVPGAPPIERLKLEQLAPTLRLQTLTPVADVVSVHGLDVPDGTQVRFVLGTMGCGIAVVSRGAASVQGGAFEIPYESEFSGIGTVSLFFQLDALENGVCDPETSQVFEVAASLPGAVDLSVLPEQSFLGCWLFET